jgi:hypothetical protein
MSQMNLVVAAPRCTALHSWVGRWAPAVAVAAFALCGPAGIARGAGSPSASAELNSITVQAQKDRETVEREAKAFVAAVAVQPWDRSLARWNTPICPLVAGLPREQGEFILSRLSQVASFAGAPLAPEVCRPNFYVVATRNPDALLKIWRKRDKNMFGNESEPKVRRFLYGGGPVRVWYNADLDEADGLPLTTDALAMYIGGASGSGARYNSAPTNIHAKLSRLQWDELRNLASVLVIVDTGRMHGINFGQLADYVALAGLTEVRFGADVGPAATILRLFESPAALPGLSLWDQAFLKALYHTDQADRMQVSVIETQVARSMAP